MSIKKKPGVLILLLLIVPSAILVLRAQNQQDGGRKVPAQTQEFKDYASKFPIVDFHDTTRLSPEEELRRQNISKRYDETSPGINENAATVVFIPHWTVPLPPLPVEKSRIVIIGQVLESRAYLSNDKSGIYSEFKIRADEILHKRSDVKLNGGDSLIAERQGGRVRFPSGHIHLSYVSDQGMPVPGQRYVLFLTEGGDNENFVILTGYELKGDRIVLLDTFNKHFKDAKQATFLDELREAVQRASQAVSAR